MTLNAVMKNGKHFSIDLVPTFEFNQKHLPQKTRAKVSNVSYRGAHKGFSVVRGEVSRRPGRKEGRIRWIKNKGKQKEEGKEKRSALHCLKKRKKGRLVVKEGGFETKREECRSTLPAPYHRPQKLRAPLNVRYHT